jgi:DNA-binding GntR family transcriptional regulator
MRRSIDKRQTSTPEEEKPDEIPDQIYRTIVSAILDRALDPGTKLPEEVFCNHYGVSRTIVRVAIHRLQYDKLVDIQRNRGCFVVLPGIEEALDVLGGRKAIEPFIVRRVSEVATESELALLRNHVDQEDEAYTNNDHRAALRLSGQFHLMLGKIAKNSSLSGFLHNLVCRSALVIATYSDVTGCCKVDDHRQLVELLTSHDVEEAVRQMSAHLNHIERDLLHTKEIEEKPSLQSVLVRYTKRGTQASKTREPRLVATPSA